MYIYIQYLCAINCSAYCEVCCSDGTPSPCSLSIWEMYCTAWWKGPPAAYTCSRNFFWEAKCSSSFRYKWFSRWWKYFMILVMGLEERSSSWDWSAPGAVLCMNNKAVSLLHLSFSVVLTCHLVRKIFPWIAKSVLSTLASLCRCREEALTGLYECGAIIRGRMKRRICTGRIEGTENGP